MLELFCTKDENKFTWESIGNLFEGRRNLGGNMPVYVYRLFQFTMKVELTKRYGKEETIAIFKDAGELAGTEFAYHMLDLEAPFNDFILQLKNVLLVNKIGYLRVEKFDLETGQAILTMGEDLYCSGVPVTGETVCHYDEGFLTGILKAYTKKEYVVTEVDCWATGAKVCRFEANIVNVGNE